MLYLKEKLNDELYFWHEDQHHSLLQVDIIILAVWAVLSKKTKISLHILQYLQKSLGGDFVGEVDFLPADKQPY